MLALGLVALLGCRDDAPIMGALSDQRATVNVEMVMAVDAVDFDGDPLTYAANSPSLPGLLGRSRFQPKRGGADFIFTPLVSDLGTHEVTFTVRDGSHRAQRRFSLEVDHGEGSTAPAFVEPLGTGTTLDLTRSACVSFDVVVTDPDTPGVTLGQAEPLVQGAELVQTSELEGAWTFCPTKEQAASGDRYTARLSADDFDNDTVVKDFLVVVRGGDGEGCPGASPVVTHTARDWTGVADIEITATISDDQGLKFEPLLYFATRPPSDPPDVTQMAQVTMELVSGSMASGTWRATLPNPVAASGAGASAPIYYLIAASDDDDPEGPCDHTTQVPAESVFTIDVVNDGGAGGLGTCEPCSADSQCDGACVNFDGGFHCFDGCDDDGDCATDEYCSFSTFTSIGGEVGRRCLPDTLSCGDAPTAGCDDDRFEDNDSASDPASIGFGATSATSCPAVSGAGDDEDWYAIDVPSEGTLELILDGGANSDLDLALYTTSGASIAQSTSTSSLEVIEACVEPGDYHVRVHAYGADENDYVLDVTHRAGGCAGTCVDDTHEPDDNIPTAQLADLDDGPFHQEGTICTWDDDWYEVPLYAGEIVYATLLFTQSAPDEDLDLLFFGADGTNYSVCDEQHPYDCDPLNGQSGTSDEVMAFAVYEDDVYYVVVHGWDGSENDYSLCIGLTPTECP